MIFCIGSSFWGRGASEKIAFENARKNAPARSRGRLRFQNCDFYWLADKDAEGAYVDDIGNFVHKKGVTAMKLVVTRLPND